MWRPHAQMSTVHPFGVVLSGRSASNHGTPPDERRLHVYLLLADVTGRGPALLPATSGQGYSCQVSCTDARRLARRRESDQRR